MAEFYVPITNHFFASQIAELLNKYNNLNVVHNAQTIQSSKTKYFVELVSSPAIEKKIIGCVGLVPEPNGLARIKHVCIDPTYRRYGIAKGLVELAISQANSDYVYMTIREDNIPSLKMAKSLGFVPAQRLWKKDHYIICVGRRKQLK